MNSRARSVKVLFRHGSLFALRNHLSGAGVWEDKRGGMRRAAKLSLDVGEIAAEAIAGVRAGSYE